MMKKQLILFAFVAVLIFVLTACGSSTDNSATNTGDVSSNTATNTASQASGDVQDVKLIASDKTFKYDQEKYVVKVGVPVQLTLVNESGQHGAQLADFGVNLTAAHPTATFTPTKKGSFLIRCSVVCGAGHMNMTAKLVVE